MKIKKVISFIIIVAIIMSIATSTLAAQSTNYGSSAISHRIDSSPITKSSGNWTKIYDRNSSITFQNSSLERYQKSQAITYVSGTARAASSEKTITTGVALSSTISSGYVGSTYLYLRIRNPYYQTSNASPMTTSGNFEGYLG